MGMFPRVFKERFPLLPTGRGDVLARVLEEATLARHNAAPLVVRLRFPIPGSIVNVVLMREMPYCMV